MKPKLPQIARVYNFIGKNPWKQGWEIAQECYAPKYTNRISEINRKYDHPIRCTRVTGDGKTRFEYTINSHFPKTFKKLVELFD